MAQIVFNHNPATFGAEPSLSSLADYAVYWPLDAAAHNGSIYGDLAGKNNLSDDGSGLTFAAWDGGDDMAAGFDGFSYALAPDAPELRQAPTMTWVFWIKTTAVAALILNKVDAGQHHIEYDIEIDADGTLIATLSGSITDANVNSSTVVADGAPHFCLVEKDASASKLRVYVDNVMEGEVSLDASYAGGAANFLLTEGTFEALIRGVGKWDRLLTEAERAALWNSGAAMVLSAT